ncbi:MAG: 2-phospho-L-lactate transferase [Candidatus Nitrosocaldus sp.]
MLFDAEDMDRIVVLAGGTGSVKLARAFYRLRMDKNNSNNSNDNDNSKMYDIHLSIVCNVGDNIWMHGLYICPDLDTIMYGLAGILDRKRGWGLIDDTFNCLTQLSRLGGEHWFMLGDKDIATHIIRSMMLREGKRLCEVTGHLCSKLGIDARIIPASDDHVETRIITDSGDMHIQEFWVKHKGMLDVKGIVYKGIDDAKACNDALDAIEDADKIVIAPGNPVSSILPILSLRGLRDAMRRARDRCTAVSPIIGNDPVSGPAAKYMRAIGYDISPVSVAEMYRDVASKLVIHETDLAYMDAIRAKGIDVYATDIIMDDEHDETRLASYLLRL